AERRGADPRRTALVRATMARQQGDLRAARAALEAARAAGPSQRQQPGAASEASPDDAEVRRQLAAVAEAEGRLAEGTQPLEELAPTEADPDVWVALARLYLQRTGSDGRVRAKAALQRALALRPEMPAARLLLGRCLRLSGQAEKARTHLERLRRERPRQG